MKRRYSCPHCSGEIYLHMEKAKPLKEYSERKGRKVDREEARKLREEGWSIKKIADRYRVSPQAIYGILVYQNIGNQ